MRTLIDIYQYWKSIGWFFRYFMIVPAVTAIGGLLALDIITALNRMGTINEELVAERKKAKDTAESLQSKIDSQRYIIESLREEIETLKTGPKISEREVQTITADTALDEALDELSGGDLE